MNLIDDLFRDGLSGRSGKVPEDMWSRINAGKGSAVPEGSDIDKLFASKLAERAGEVPADMWSRIAAGAVPVVPSGEQLDQIFADGLKERTGEVPTGMWERIWTAVSGPTPALFSRQRMAIASAALLLLLLGGLYGVSRLGEDKVAPVIPMETPAVATTGETPVEERVTAATEEAASESVDLRPVAMPDEANGLAEQEKVSPSTIGSPTVEEEIDLGDQNVAVREEVPTEAENVLVAPATNTNQEKVINQLEPQATGLAGAVVEGEAVATPRNTPSAALELPRADAVAMLPLAAQDITLKRHTRIKSSGASSFRSAPRHRFQTELLFGAAYARQEFTALEPGQEFLRQIRETSEFPDLSYQITLRGSYKLNERLLLLGGLTYAEIRNEFEHEPLINGQPTLVRTTNRIRQLEAPLLLGFSLPGQRLSVSLNAGPVVNLTTSVQGRFLDPDSLQPRDLAVAGNYRRNTGVGFMTSLSTTYKVGKKEPFILLVEPFFKAYPGSFTIKGAPLKEKYWVAGLQLGVRKAF